MTLEEKKIERLYKLLRKEQREANRNEIHAETAAALRWAISELERLHNITVH